MNEPHIFEKKDIFLLRTLFTVIENLLPKFQLNILNKVTASHQSSKTHEINHIFLSLQRTEIS